MARVGQLSERSGKEAARVCIFFSLVFCSFGLYVWGLREAASRETGLFRSDDERLWTCSVVSERDVVFGRYHTRICSVFLPSRRKFLCAWRLEIGVHYAYVCVCAVLLYFFTLHSVSVSLKKICAFFRASEQRQIYCLRVYIYGSLCDDRAELDELINGFPPLFLLLIEKRAESAVFPPNCWRFLAIIEQIYITEKCLERKRIRLEKRCHTVYVDFISRIEILLVLLLFKRRRTMTASAVRSIDRQASGGLELESDCFWPMQRRFQSDGVLDAQWQSRRTGRHFQERIRRLIVPDVKQFDSAHFNSKHRVSH